MSLRSVIESFFGLGIREYVVCAGAHNLPIVEALVSHEQVHLWNHYDERSAGFFALGRTMATGEPCCVVTTSGTAVANLLPAVVEAFYQGRPLLLLTADRPSVFRGSGAPQAIEHVGVFSHYVLGSLDIENGPCDLSQWNFSGPFHVNVCLLEQEPVPQVGGGIAEFKRPRSQIMVGSLVRFLEDSWDGLVVALGGLEPEDREEVFHFLKDIKVPVIADATSGLREALGNLNVAHPEKFLGGGMMGKVLRIGDVPVGRFWRNLEKQAIDVLSITRTGLSGLARQSKLIQGDITRILKGIGQVGVIGDVMGSLDKNARDWALVDELIERYPDSEPGMIRVTSQYASMCQSLYLGNSLPIREWNQFAQRSIPIEFVRANRGANGIDGQISTWLGNTAGVDNSWCVLGDLTTLYDFSGLAMLDQAKAEGRVLVVINNKGGRIFEQLPRVIGLSSETQALVTNAHHLSFEYIAKHWGMDYQCFTSSSEIEIEPSATPLLVELVPDAEESEQLRESWAKV
jgi:2-succinyl-5-enolpyruvyl-6-hydroxy-3-cyclohexene-1-carboxylate synthase